MTVHFVGAGPGAADLITVRGQELIAQADVIIYAGSLVNAALLELAQPQCRFHNSATMTLNNILEVIQETENRGESLVRLHSGDPSLYGATHEQMRVLDRLNIDFDICPGVSSLSGAAAALRIEYTIPELTQSVVITRMPGRTPMPAHESVADFAQSGSTMVLFLSASLLDGLSDQLVAGGRSADEPAAIVYKATWPDEEQIVPCTIATLAQAARDHNIRSTALIVVGPCLTDSATVSRLYSQDFSTSLREARP